MVKKEATWKQEIVAWGLECARKGQIPNLEIPFCREEEVKLRPICNIPKTELIKERITQGRFSMKPLNLDQLNSNCCKFQHDHHSFDIIIQILYVLQIILVNSGPAPAQQSLISSIFTWHWLGGLVGGRSVTLCSSAQEPARDMFNTFLGRGQIEHEDLAITNPDFPSQESGTSFMSPKGHILT